MLTRAENSLLVILRTGPMSGHLRTIDSMNALDAMMQGRQDVRQIDIDTPAAYVTAVGAKIGDTTARVRAVVMLAARNTARPVGHVDRTRAAQPQGLNLLADLAVQALDGATADDILWQVRELDPVDGEVFAAAGVGLIAVMLEAEVDRQFVEVEGLDPFETFHAQLDIAPHAGSVEHDKWLEEPADHGSTAPDATDQVSLEQT